MKTHTTKRKALSAVLTRNNAAATAPTTNRLTHLTWNLSTKLVRNEKMEDRDYIVVPMVMLTEGVHAGSNGPLFYPGGEIKKAAKIWNMKPVVVYHTEIDGQGVSACQPELLTKQKIGVVMNAKYDDAKKRLTAEAWLEEDRIKKVDNRVWDAIKHQKTMELSTGLFTENEEVEGDFGGEKYNFIARNHGPDHLAVLPDQIGACSIEKGAGFIRNELRAAFVEMDTEDMELCRARILSVLKAEKKNDNAIKILLANEASHEQERDALYLALQKLYPADEGYAYPWIEAVYDAFVIYCLNGRIFKVGYSSSDAGVTIVGDPTPVARVTEYRAISGNSVTSNKKSKSNSNEANTMNKEQLVADLITNGGYSETDRTWLMGLDETALGKLRSASTAVANKAKAPAIAAPAANVETAKSAAAAPAVEVLNASQKSALAYGERMLAENRAKLVTKITANKANTFTAEQLASMPIEALEGIAALATNTAVETPAGGQPNFSGLGLVGNNAAPRTLTENDALVAPGLDFSAPVAPAKK